MAAGAAWAEGEKLAESSARRAAQSTFKGLRTLVDQPALQGAAQLGRAVTDPLAARKFGENYVAGLTPGVVSGIAQTIDPTARAPENIPEAIASRIPGLSQFVPPRIGLWGQPETGEPTAVGRFIRAEVDPTASTRDRTLDDPLLAEMERVGANIPKLTRWPEEETQDWLERQMFVGQARKQAVEAAIAFPEYNDEAMLSEAGREIMMAKPELNLRTIPEAIAFVRAKLIESQSARATTTANQQFRYEQRQRARPQ